MITYSLKVVNIRIETEDTITLCFKQPSLRKIKYKAGQYLSLIFRINGRRYVRPYSFSSAPKVDSLLEITVKRVFKGIVSNYIHDHIKVDDIIEVMEPQGDFVLDFVENVDCVYLWGVGSGITPLISLTKQILNDYPTIKVNLIYGNRNHEQTIFLNFIQNLSLNYPKTFKVWHFHTQLSVNEKNPNIIQGRIDGDSVCHIVEGNHNDNALHYICGPEGLKSSITEALSKINIEKLNILSEDFELIKNPEDFEDIHTRRVEIIYSGKNYSVEVIKGSSILESALDAGIELPYSCQTGTCSTCVARLTSGKVRMIGLKVPREDLNDNEYLLCCSHPLTESILIEV